MRKFLLTASVLTAPFLGMAAAHANPISVGYSINGGAITSFASSTTGNVDIANGTGIDGGNYTLGVQASAFPALSFVSPNFTSTTLDATGVGGTLTIYVTQSGISASLSNYLAELAFTSVSLTDATISEAFYLNSPDGTGTPLASATFLNTGADGADYVNIPTQSSDYSITGVYSITFNGTSGNAGAGQSFTDVPEPASLALLGAGLAGLGMIRRRKKNSNAAA